MEIKFVTIKGKSNYSRTVVDENQFKQLFVKEGKSKKWFAKNGVGHRRWRQTLDHWGYDEKTIENLRRNKILKGSTLNKTTKFSERVIRVSNRFPEIAEALKLYESNPAIMAQTIMDINTSIYELKEDLRLIKKHVNNRLTRNDIKVNFVANALENKVKIILDELNLNHISSWKVDNSFYDFYLPEYNLLIEVDGKQHHSPKLNLPKNRLAKSKGYKLLRIKEKNVKYVHYIKDKISKALG